MTAGSVAIMSNGGISAIENSGVMEKSRDYFKTKKVSVLVLSSSFFRL
jgi:hypothetical protein